MPRTTPLASIAATLAVAGLLIGACSSSAPDVGRSGTGGSGESSARGGSGGTGGSAQGGTSGKGASGGTSNATGGSSNGTSTGGSATGGSANATSSGGSGAYPTNACEGLAMDNGGQGGDQACTGVASEAEPVAVDLFIMMDRSISMAQLVPGTDLTRWQALEQAVQDFATSTRGDDIRAGLGFFGLTGGSDDAIDCIQSRYSEPVVPIDTLDQSGPAIVSAMNDMAPGGLTPTGPALAGALDYAASWAKDHPGRATGVVLVSDGYPTQCAERSLSEIAAIAEQAHLNAPYVRTYVIGLDAEFNLDAIALSGGTHVAFKVDKGDISGSFSAALHNVANTKLACEYALPPPPAGNQKLDLTRVQVIYSTAGDASNEEIPALSGIDACANSPNGGWYYDNPSAPMSIMVCPCTCARFDAGRVDVRVGCRPAVGPR
ncbi:MAG TPA: hypothetical protein VLJ38_07415 [Polyangiaceae bacterium]|nr:hypothetical protein [Polyangiaceae bacterium]